LVKQLVCKQERRIEYRLLSHPDFTRKLLLELGPISEAQVIEVQGGKTIARRVDWLPQVR